MTVACKSLGPRLMCQHPLQRNRSSYGCLFKRWTPLVPFTPHKRAPAPKIDEPPCRCFFWTCRARALGWLLSRFLPPALARAAKFVETNPGDFFSEQRAMGRLVTRWVTWVCLIFLEGKNPKEVVLLWLSEVTPQEERLPSDLPLKNTTFLNFLGNMGYMSVKD